MQERNALTRINQELYDQVMLIELGEAEKDQKVITEAEEALRKLKAEVSRRELEALLSGEADNNDTYLEVHAGAGGTESRTGLRCCFACTRAGPSSTVSRSISWKRPGAKRPGSNRRRSKSRAAMPMAGSRPKTAFTGWSVFRRSIPMHAATRHSPA